MSANRVNFSNIILITGNPGVGKSTLVKKLFEKLKENQEKFSLDLKGFYTQEIRDLQTNERTGFDVIDLSDHNRRASLARTREALNINSEQTSRSRNWPQVGKYLVDVKSFENIALPILNINSNCICLLDEIGKMEMFSSLFQQNLGKLLNEKNKSILFVLTVPIKSLPFSDKLKSNELSKLYTVTFQNRNEILDDVYQSIEQGVLNFKK